MTYEERLTRLEAAMESMYDLVAILCAENDISAERVIDALDVLTEDDRKPLAGLDEHYDIPVEA